MKILRELLDIVDVTDAVDASSTSIADKIQIGMDYSHVDLSDESKSKNGTKARRLKALLRAKARENNPKDSETEISSTTNSSAGTHFSAWMNES